MPLDAVDDGAGDVTFSATPVTGANQDAHPAVYAINQADPSHPYDILVRNNAGVYKCARMQAESTDSTLASLPLLLQSKV